jgi:hemerythrin-like domain-containing protein
MRYRTMTLTLTREEGQPTTRAPELQDFSEEHQHVLVHAQQLKTVAVGDGENPADDAAKTFLEFWQKEASAHFRTEEDVLLPVLARYGENMYQRPVVEMLAQHSQIRGLVMRLSDEVIDGDIRLETLGSIGRALEAHIQLEEREVFPMIEMTLPGEALKEVASRLAVKEAGPHVEPWVPGDGLSYASAPGQGDSEGGGWDY